jgi:hypothetical protein
MVMTCHLEERLGTRFNDDEVAGIRRLRDLVNLVAEHQKRTGDAASEPHELTNWAVMRLGQDPWWQPISHGRRPSRDDTLDLDAQLLDALDPIRWEPTV